MRIFIDGDACSTKNIRKKFMKKNGAEIVTIVSIENYSGTCHGREAIVVDSSPQATDIEIFNRVQQGDIVITKDYGLASLVLGKKGKAVSPSGFTYTQKNIGILLKQSYVNGAVRHESERKKKRSARQRSVRIQPAY
ncbi:hypothetical protein CSB45_04760 [candidate division KSB3 bacterium]|uniref:Uncharacterized protein n=1 Tax=candidate division KSB3 bacterium TaxID=2044937 RepID=A0A2G6E7D2_9BACT|nr:MAG: hypothetical protein CSB45_04760 [candidate division KSB3 bacterium]PIE30367.1 MAG: hypothetical protein CSA57_03530 [candidate division KSB3 bacterium]